MLTQMEIQLLLGLNGDLLPLWVRQHHPKLIIHTPVSVTKSPVLLKIIHITTKQSLEIVFKANGLVLLFLLLLQPVLFLLTPLAQTSPAVVVVSPLLQEQSLQAILLALA